MVNVGIIGCGSITKFRHGPEYSDNPNSTIKGFFDPRVDRAQAMVEEFAPITIAALKAGKHVLCEKPMATSIKEGQAMIDAAKESGKFLMIGYNQRLVPAHIRAKEILGSGEMGDILSFRTIFSHGGPEAWSADKSKGTWFFKKQDAFMGAMGDLGIHKADFVRWLIGDEIEEVIAFITTLNKKDDTGNLIEVDDNGVCIFKSKKGIIGTLAASWTCYGREDNSTVLYCTNGILRICDHPEYPVIATKKER